MMIKKNYGGIIMGKNKKKYNKEIFNKYIGNYTYNGDDPRADWDGNDEDTRYPKHDKTDYTNAVGRAYKKNNE